MPRGSDATTPRPGEWSRQFQLRDGTPVFLRQIRPEDRDRIAAGMRELSPASRYLRFHEVVEELSDEQLDYLSVVDHVDHEAIVALDLTRPRLPGVGVARFIRDARDPEIAEAAITVADRYQATGAGTLLLGALAGRASESGIRIFRNYVLDGNDGMLEVFDHLGAERELQPDGLWRVDLGVPSDGVPAPETAAGQAFFEVALGRRRPPRGLSTRLGRLRDRDET